MEEDMISLTALDRCDRCGAQAYAVARRSGVKSDLLFCLHHRKEFFDSLVMDHWTIIDDGQAIEGLLVKPGASV